MNFFSTNIFKKIVMAVSGLGMIGFLITHLAGNLLLFKSAETFNHYSHSLISNPLIGVAELGLVLLLLSHLINAIVFTKKNKEARPIAYYQKKGAGHTSRRSLSSRGMIVSGLFVLLFIIIHLKTFKYGPHYEVAGETGVRDLHRLVLEEFHEPEEVAFYVFVMFLIGAHLWHGFGSSFESLGVRYRPWVRGIGKVLSVVIAGGFALIPLIIFFSK